jgi:hypothetical protein
MDTSSVRHNGQLDVIKVLVLEEGNCPNHQELPFLSIKTPPILFPFLYSLRLLLLESLWLRLFLSLLLFFRFS